MNEFPHNVTFLTFSDPEPDGGGGYIPGTGGWKTYDTIEGFLDTPTSEQIYKAHQLQHPFDRYLFFLYRTDITVAMRVKCESDTYELVGKPLDQGGQHEVMRVSLRLIPDA
ncbi:phage head closure protein [Virgibacillus doumboii]|uniref:phage head closure protein n=1 Tax=Virgibacillus doumboii TaxID=2697503 RepID=UPI0013DFEABE|nr:phage head closure protein [Virgibacillus doumboii]